MLLIVMVLCAVGAILLFSAGAFDDLWDVWSHPEHKDIENDSHHPKTRPPNWQ